MLRKLSRTMIMTSGILENCRKNLENGRAVATGIGIFGRVITDEGMLLRRRTEKDSLYGKDLSGKWELIGGGVEVIDFGTDYQSAIRTALQREFAEEAFLALDIKFLDILLRPAWLGKNGIYDLAFAVDIPTKMLLSLPGHRKLLEKGGLQWVPISKLEEIEFVSSRMKYLATQGIL
jgi:8-oxo-dGTP pyrophosphatase MutT (NUDIX family)